MTIHPIELHLTLLKELIVRSASHLCGFAIAALNEGLENLPRLSHVGHRALETLAGSHFLEVREQFELARQIHVDVFHARDRERHD